MDLYLIVQLVNNFVFQCLIVLFQQLSLILQKIRFCLLNNMRISDEAVAAAKEYIAGAYGENYICPYKRVWKTKSATAAQDAHEAIRPSVPSLTPDEVDNAARLAGAMGDLNGNMSRGRRTGRLLTLYRSKGLFGALFERGSRGIHNLSHPFLYQVIVCQYLKECILSGRHAKQNTMKKGGSQN